MDKKKIGLNQNFLNVNFNHNTLVISYKKPSEIIEDEMLIVDEIRKIKNNIKDDPNKQYDPGCQHQ